MMKPNSLLTMVGLVIGSLLMIFGYTFGGLLGLVFGFIFGIFGFSLPFNIYYSDLDRESDPPRFLQIDKWELIVLAIILFEAILVFNLHLQDFDFVVVFYWLLSLVTIFISYRLFANSPPDKIRRILGWIVLVVFLFEFFFVFLTDDIISDVEGYGEDRGLPALGVFILLQIPTSVIIGAILEYLPHSSLYSFFMMSETSTERRTD